MREPTPVRKGREKHHLKFAIARQVHTAIQQVGDRGSMSDVEYAQALAEVLVTMPPVALLRET